MPGLMGLFKHSPKNSPRLNGSEGAHSTTLSPATSGLAPVSSIRSMRSARAVPAQTPPPIQLKFQLESGPLIMYGLPEQSTGALLSGVLELDVNEDTTLASSELRLVQKTTYKVGPNKKKLAAKDYPVNLEGLAQWDILMHPQPFHVGVHEYPFSHLLPGALPPSIVHHLFEIEYYLEAHVIVNGLPNPVTKILPLSLGRSTESVQDKTSLRLFPPTELSLSITLPSHIFPKGSFVSELRVDNLNGDAMPDGRFQRWTVRKISWQFLEKTVLTLPSRAEIEQEDIIYQGYLKSGWKFDGSNNGVTEIITRDFSSHQEDLRKDIKDDVLKINVSHKLTAEVLIAEETASSRTSAVGIPTGRARVLRVQFGLSVVDTPGLGISWDDEVPPVYADVPLSPPTYDTPSALEEIPHMTFSPIAPVTSPTLRHIDPTIGDINMSRGPTPLGESFISRIKQRAAKNEGGIRPVQSAPSHR